MCGLFVVVQRGTPVLLERALQATRQLQHRGPDGWHHLVQSLHLTGPQGPVPLQVFLGHTRLAIMDPLARSDQPLQRGAHTLAYNGEVYNFRALRRQLAQQSEGFETEGDTEVLLSLLRRHGVQGLAEANGQWAFCLLDAAAGTLTAARDRYGKKPLFWYADAQTLCLASEIAPLLHYLGRKPRMRPAALHQFLRWGWLYPQPDGGTHVEGIRQVRAGAALHVDLARWQWHEQPWFDLAAHVVQTPAPRSQTDLAALLEDAVRQRLVSDRRVGLLLSGGVDSSLLLGVLHHLGMRDQVTCFTGDAGKSEDTHFAEACIRQLGIDAVRLPLDYSATGMEAFLEVCRHQEKPFPLIGNVLAMPQMYAEIARHGVPVVLDGTGADEVFAGYRDRYARFAVWEAVQHGDEGWIGSLLQANADHPHLHAMLQQALTTARAGTAPTPPLPGIQGLDGDPPGIDALLHPQVHTAPPVDPLRLFSGSLGEALVLDAQQGRLLEWLWHNDRNGMAFGIENRSPFLDHRLAPCMTSGLAGKFEGPWNKFALRQLFDAFAPSMPTQWRRDKQGFRWVYHRFLQQNKGRILELVSASALLPQCMDVAVLLEAARADESWLECSLLQRALSVAGVEQAMGLTEP